MMEKFTEEEKSILTKAAREGTEPSTQVKAKFVRVVEELKGCHETMQFILSLGKNGAINMSKTFEQIWSEKEAEGYQYGEDALEQVRFGWELRQKEIDELKECELAADGYIAALQSRIKKPVAQTVRDISIGIAQQCWLNRALLPTRLAAQLDNWYKSQDNIFDLDELPNVLCRIARHSGYCLTYKLEKLK